MNEYEAHLSSYDHSHKQRLKDMRQLTRDPLASSKARKAEAKANSQSGLISIKLGDSGSSGGGASRGGASRGGASRGWTRRRDSDGNEPSAPRRGLGGSGDYEGDE